MTIIKRNATGRWIDRGLVGSVLGVSSFIEVGNVNYFRWFTKEAFTESNKKFEIMWCNGDECRYINEHDDM